MNIAKENDIMAGLHIAKFIFDVCVWLEHMF